MFNLLQQYQIKHNICTKQ